MGAVSLPPARYENPEQQIAFLDRLIERLESIPGVESAAAGSHLPLAGGGNDTYVGVPGRLELGSDQQFNSQIRAVSAGYFEAMGIPLLAGRTFGGAEQRGGPAVVVIDQSFADAIFADENPVGQTIAIDLGEPHVAEIVGVVGAVNHFALGASPGFHMYLPYAQVPVAYMRFALRTSVDPTTLLDDVPVAVTDVDPLLPVANLATYEDVISRGLAQPRFQTLLLGMFAAVALLLAVIGVYGVLSYFVMQRRREVGVRLALGARQTDVVGLIVRRGAGLALVGLLLGTAASLLLTRYMSSLLFGVSPTDVGTFVGVAALLAGTSLAASYVPARRAARVDPTVTLRQE